MHEDEFYRALQKRIRAEEMLKASSLPPSMAKREKIRPQQKVCSKLMENEDKAYLVLAGGNSNKSRGGRSKKKSSLEKEFDALQREFVEGGRKVKGDKVVIVVVVWEKGGCICDF